MAVPLGYRAEAAPETSTLLPRKPIYKNLTFQVVTAITILGLIGFFSPRGGGIASMGNLKKAGRVGLKAIGYFEVVTTMALAIGLVVANVARPGVGIDRNSVKVTEEATQQVAKYQAAGEQQKDFAQVVLHIIPHDVFAALAGGDIIPVLC